MAYFNHTHPYPPFLFPEAEKILVGTLPPPRFTTGLLKNTDVNFCYGSRDGQLWPILDRIFNLDLTYANTPTAVTQRKEFLMRRKIGICDIVASAQRRKVDASDLGMEQVELRNLLGYLRGYPKVKTILFTGGNSKNGPEYFFRKLLKEYGIKLETVESNTPRVHRFVIPESMAPVPGKPAIKIAPLPGDLKIDKGMDTGARLIHTVSLIAPSGAANRAVGSLREYKVLKKKNPEATTLDFRVMQYSKYF